MNKELTEDNVVEGAELRCTKATNDFYTVGSVYIVESVIEGQDVYLTDNESGEDPVVPHPWSMDCLLKLGQYDNWLTQFEIA